MFAETFFLIFVLTILVIRVWLFLIPRHLSKMFGFQWHHYMTGLLLIALYVVYPNILLLAVGTAFIVDQLPLFFIYKGLRWPDNCWAQYQSKASWLGIVALVILLGVSIDIGGGWGFLLH